MPGLLPGDPARVGVYRIAGRLGSGGQGVVYEAYGPTGERVAVKVPSPRVLEVPGARTRLAKEVAAARRVASFCTARILDADTATEQPYLVSEFVPGLTLQESVREHGPYRDDDLVRLAMGLATAVAAIHGAKVMHRDLKPSNVLIGPDGPRVIDFGLARSEDMTRTDGLVGGTLGYMAPEVLSGNPPMPASDIFAWGAVVLFAATGRHPFGGANDAEIIYRTMEHRPDTGTLPGLLAELVERALERENPARRPTAHTVLTRLLGLGHEEGPEAVSLLSAGQKAASVVHAGVDDLLAHRGLAERAEAAHGALSRAARLRAREVLLRFVVAGTASDGAQDDIRVVDEDEFFADRDVEEREVFQEVLDAFQAEQVLERAGDNWRLPSVALCAAWPRMQEWLVHDRQQVRRARDLGDAAAAWHRGGRRSDDLLRGDGLRDHANAYADAPAYLRPTPAELRFLTASQQAEMQRIVRKRWRLAWISVLVALATVAGAFAVYQLQISQAREEQDAARTVAAIAESVRVSDPETAMLLSAAASEIADVDDTRAALYNSLDHGVDQIADNPVPVPETRPMLGYTDQLLGHGRLATVVEGEAAEVWDLGARKRLGYAPLPGNTGETSMSALFSVDGGKVVAPTGADGGAQLVGLTASEPERGPLLLKGQTVGVRSLSHNAGRAVLSGVEEAGIRQTVVDTVTGSILWSRLVDYESDPVLSPDGRTLAVCTAGEPVRLVDLHTKTSRSLLGPSDSFDTECADETQLVFSADGSHLVSSFESLHATVWNTHEFRAQSAVSLPVEEVPGQWAVNSDATLVAAAVRGRVLLWQRTGDKYLEAARFPTGSLDAGSQSAGEVRALAFDSSRPRLRFVEDDRRVRSVDLSWLADPREADEGREALFAPEAGAVVHHSVHGDSLTLTNSTHRHRLATAGSPLVSLVDTSVGAFSADGKRYGHIIAAKDKSLRLQIWSTDNGRSQGRPLHLSGTDEPEGIAFSPDGTRVAVSRLDTDDYKQRSIELWDWKRGRHLAVFPDTGAPRIVFSPDGSLLISSAGDRIDLISQKTQRHVWGQAGIRDIAFSPDGSTLALSTDRGSIDLWDRTVTRRIGAIPPIGNTDTPVTGLRFSPDNELLAGVDDTGIRLWDIKDRRRLGGPLRLAGGQGTAVGFDQDGRLHVASTLRRNQTVDLEPEAVVKDICQRVDRDLTDKEWDRYLPHRTPHPICPSPS